MLRLFIDLHTLGSIGLWEGFLQSVCALAVFGI